VRSAAASLEAPVRAAPDEPLLRRAAEAAARLRPGSKKLRRKVAAPTPVAAPALPAPVDEDDIFADVGQHCPAAAAPLPVPHKALVPGTTPAAALPRLAAHVDEIYAAIEAAELAEGGPAADAARVAREQARLAELQAAEEAPAYGELYPGGEAYASLLDGGSDDDEGPAVKNAGGAVMAKGKGRGKGDKAEKAADAKLGVQLADVRRALTEKHGDKHESAFAKPKRTAAEAPAVSESEAADAKARAKRLKL
jgi:hypothetical protein